MKKEYPYNLLMRAYGIEFSEKPLTADQKDGLQDFINSLNKRMYRVITDRYMLNLPVEFIAASLNITKQAVKNTERKIIEKMQQPINMTKIKFGLMGSAKIDDNSLEHLGLSIRVYNALKRGGISFLSDIESIHQLHVIRNFGETAKSEVIEKLAGRGIVLK